jgi:predicted dehydrogenase
MKIAICGAGDMGRMHFDAFSAAGNVSIVAVSDPRAETLGRFSEKGVRTFADSEEMLDSVDADAAVIATPTAFHAPLAVRALGRGMHVFSEKPMARTVKGAMAMAEAAEKSGKVLAIGHVLRFHDAYRTAKKLITDGSLGNIGTIRTSRCGKTEPSWRSDIDANGGVAFELMTHDVDWLTWALGPVERVFARGLAAETDRTVRDYCLAILRFKSGAVAHIEGSFAEAEGFFAAYEVAGSGGLLSYDTRKSTVLDGRLLTENGLRTISETPQEERPFNRQIKAFVRAAGGGEAYDVPVEEALYSLRVTAAILESVRTGRQVEP